MPVARKEELVLVRDKKGNVYKAFAGALSDDLQLEPASKKVSLVTDTETGSEFKVFSDQLGKFSSNRFRVNDSWGDSWGDSSDRIISAVEEIRDIRRR